MLSDYSPKAYLTPKQPWMTLILVMAAAFFGGLCWWYTLNFWPPIPYYDEWRNIPFVLRIAEGESGFGSLMAPDDGYTVLWFRLAAWIETRFFDYDPRVSIVMGLFFITGASLLLILYFKKKLTITSLFMFAASCALIFGLNNWENLLAFWLVNSAGVLFFMLLALMTLPIPKLYWLSVFSAVMCALSFANGLMIWPCSILVLLLQRRWRATIPILAIGVVVTLKFWMDRHVPSHGAFDFGTAVLRFFAALGIPFEMTASAISGVVTDRDGGISVAAGVASFVAFLMVGLRTLRAARTPSFCTAVAVILFGIGSCAMIALGRADLGTIQATSSRYYGTIAIAYIGLFMLTAELVDREIVRFNGWAVASFTTLAAVAAIHSEVPLGPFRSAYFEEGRRQMLEYKNTSPTSPIFFNSPDFSIHYLVEMERLQLGPFRK